MKTNLGRYCFKILFLLFSVGLVACSRAVDSSHSNLSITLPSKPLLRGKLLGKNSALTLGTRKECFGVTVMGPDIAGVSRNCGPTTGISAGYKGAGETISLDVPAGSSRQVDVFMLLLPAGQTQCPSWDQGMKDPFGSIFYSSYKVGSVSGVEVRGAEAQVTVKVQPPTDLSKNIMVELGTDSNCKITPNARLQSNGDITNNDGSSKNLDVLPTVSTISNFIPSDFSAASLLSLAPGAILSSPVGDFDVPPYIQSIIRYPGNNSKILGLRLDGQIISINISTGQASELSSTTCPLSSCKIPVWMKSVALGPNNSLYSIDHGGNVYFYTSAGPLPTSTQYPPYVDQIAF